MMHEMRISYIVRATGGNDAMILRWEGEKYKTNFCDGSCFAYCAVLYIHRSGWGCQIKRSRIFVVIVAPHVRERTCSFLNANGFFPYTYRIISEF